MAWGKEEILALIYRAVDEFNEMQEEDEQLEKSPDTVLFYRAGYTGKGVLDSMGLVNFLVTLDELMDAEQQTVGIAFNINDALDAKETVLKNLGSLADHLMALSKKA